jgi:hypothetical protein
MHHHSATTINLSMNIVSIIFFPYHVLTLQQALGDNVRGAGARTLYALIQEQWKIMDDDEKFAPFSFS